MSEPIEIDAEAAGAAEQRLRRRLTILRNRLRLGRVLWIMAHASLRLLAPACA